MSTQGKSIARFAVILSLCFLSSLTQAQPQSPLSPPPDTAPQNGRGPAIGPRGGRGGLVNPRVQNRTYTFTDTGESMPYAVFVSSKVSKDRKAPLIVALHGLGGSPVSLLRGKALDLAEEGGYILVGPMGYNSSGWYGIPARGGGRGARRAAPARGVAAGGTVVTNQARVRELSEKDVMIVLEMMRKEFNVDERRTYLMGHSMGGAGTLYLGVKYATNWAAIAAFAPAAFSLNPDSLAKIKDMPVIIVQGDADTAVPVEGTRRWAEKLKVLNMTHVYKEIPGGDHGNVITDGMPDVFKFFGTHSTTASP